MVKLLAALVAALSILNSSGASPGATEKVAALVARATCSGVYTALNIMYIIWLVYVCVSPRGGHSLSQMVIKFDMEQDMRGGGSLGIMFWAVTVACSR